MVRSLLPFGRSPALAVSGGSPALAPGVAVERWQRPRDREKALIGELLDTDALSGAGVGVGKAFELAFAQRVGARHCLTFSHGTAALMAACHAAGVGPGDEVIAPVIGYIGSYAGALHLGARPVFVDLDPSSLVLDAQRVAAAITPRTRAIVVVHLNGRVADLDALMTLSRERGIPLIDDASHALGAVWDGRPVGSVSTITCFSLQGVDPTGKPVSAGEGGVACTGDAALAQRMLSYCHLHRAGLEEDLAGSPQALLGRQGLGLKWRAHPLAMALATASLESLDVRHRGRAECYRRTAELVASCAFLSLPQLDPRASMGGWYDGIKVVYDPGALGGVALPALVAALRKEGIPAKPNGLGTLEHLRPLMSGDVALWGAGRGPIGDAWHGLEPLRPGAAGDFPVAESMNPRVLTLPSFVDVAEPYWEGLCLALSKIERHSRKLLA